MKECKEQREGAVRPDDGMKVLHIYKAYPPVIGGVEKSLRLLAERQAESGLEVTVLVCDTGPSSVQIENNVQIVRTHSWGTLASTPLGLELFRWVRRQAQSAESPQSGQASIDITHLHAPYPIGELAHLFSGRSRATVITYHSDIVRQRWLGRLYRPFQRLVLQQADCILASSHQLLQSSGPLQAVAEKCHMVPLGIDPRPLQHIDPVCTARIRSQLHAACPHSCPEPLEKPLVLFVGRLRYYKGLDVLIDAMPHVPGCLAIIGSGPMEEVWRAHAQRSPAAARIHFQGEVPEQHLAAYYAAADVLVLPSTQRAETFGLVQLEAMAAGVPVISTELGTGTSFVNLDGQTGRIVPPGDVGALAAALSELLGSTDERRRMGQAGRQRVEALFHIDTTVEQITQLYREVLVQKEGS